jgi:hypothetical protein
MRSMCSGALRETMVRLPETGLKILILGTHISNNRTPWKPTIASAAGERKTNLVRSSCKRELERIQTCLRT